MGTTSNRDYYADLEVTQGAEEAEIKKAYRKLALKYHPDRHPGREDEYNPKFLVIQEAHDVLTDPEQRAKYDASRRPTSRYPAASGVRGNPWSHVSNQFPTPPRRNAAPPRGATSGADRWSGRFASHVPPTARQPPMADAQTKKNAAKAFESMRKEKPQANSRKAPAPPPPPRTEAQKNRANAAFGTRKATGYQPRGSAADEPPVVNNNYSSTRDFERPVPESPKAQPAAQSVPQAAPMADPLNQFRDNSDVRTASPYIRHGGERTNPFEGVIFGRSKSTREPAARTGASSTDDTPVRKRASTQGFAEKTAEQQQDRPPSADGGISSGHGMNESPNRPSRQPQRKPRIFNLDGDETPPQRNGDSENIDTTFTSNQKGAWQFTAGGSDGGAVPKSRARSAGAAARHSPSDRPSMPQMAASDSGQPGHQSDSTFNAENWTNKFGSQNFSPQPTGSPTKPTRAPLKKTRSTTSAQPENVIVIDSSDEEDNNFKWPGRKAQTNNTTDSPQAMDIDTPPPNKGNQTNGARSIPVEPSRPEWRSGNFDSANGKHEQKETDDVVPKPNQGSEDTTEFAANFADFKNVPPFAAQAAGFKSMNDLKDNLPFESKPSGQIHIGEEKIDGFQPLAFPPAPEGPRLPPTMAITGMKPTAGAWSKYVREFEEYMKQWDAFDKQVTDHFTARLADNQRIREEKGYAFLRSWGSEGCIEYYRAVRQDNDVREKWHRACGDHEKHLQDFLAFRERMRD